MTRRRRPWGWRWLVVLHDLQPGDIHPYREVVYGYFFKRDAHAHAQSMRWHYLHRDGIRIDVVRNG